jgi:hypothetical protein
MNLLKKQIRRVEKQEKRLINKPENAFYKARIAPTVNAIQDKIPDKLKNLLDTAFFKGFELVFEKGAPYIEMTYNKNKIKQRFSQHHEILNDTNSSRGLRRLDGQSKRSSLLNTTFSIAEGGILGLLGIGLPDIPLLSAVIIKNIQETALSYGFDYESDREKAYMMLLICGAMSQGEQRRQFNHQLTLHETRIEHNTLGDIDLKIYMRNASDVLSNALLTAKFIQGIPVAGVLGAFVNYSVLNRIGKFSGLKYKKRYLKAAEKKQT